MNQLMATAERLHAVEDAMGEFIMRWALDELINEVAGSDRIHGDIRQASEDFSNFDSPFLFYRPGMDD